jgi:methionyl aminopeptidase
MITIKSDGEVQKMAAAGKIIAEVFDVIEDYVVPGVTTVKLNDVAEEYIVSQGAVCSSKGYDGFPFAICASVNDEAIHGFPSARRLENGDIVSLDITASVDGFNADAARTFPVGDISEDAQRLIDVTRQCFFEGLRHARSGERVSDVSRSVFVCAKNHDFGVIQEYCGHGIGRDMHEEPSVPNCITRRKGVRLEPGMAICIEPMINAGGDAIRVLDDGWTVVTKDGSLSCHYENTVLITDGDPRVLTLLG